MLGVPLDTRVRRTLAVTVGEGLALTLDDTPSSYFAAHINQPQGDNGLTDGSPRDELSPYRLYRAGPESMLGACYRVEDLDGTVYELLSKPKPLQNGRRIIGHSAPILPVGDLYPRSAEVWELGGEAALASVECAVYSERSEQRGRGEYHGTFAEAPASAWATLSGGGNRSLRFADGSEWRILDATLAPELPFVSMSIRKTG